MIIRWFFGKYGNTQKYFVSGHSRNYISLGLLANAEETYTLAGESNYVLIEDSDFTVVSRR